MGLSMRRRDLCGFALLSVVPPLGAQGLSSPMPGVQPAHPLNGIPQGQGAGVHSPLSPFKPLPERLDVVPWSALTNIEKRIVNRRVQPVFPQRLVALHQNLVRVQGFMMPLEPGQAQRRFLLTSVPLTCSFCTPGGAESMVEVIARDPVKYTTNALVMQGRLHVLTQDPTGLFYRMSDAMPVR
ncbi:MAG: hypothetical protein RJB34_541 [Pseudomonadota bacterium]|jgi:hypothetical protein